MKKITLLTILAITTLQLSYCGASKARVMRMEGGVNKAEFIDADKETTKNKVLSGSNEFCEKEGKKAVIVSENTTISGTFDEKTTNAIKKAGVIGGVLGSVDAANTSAAATEDAKYTTVMMFKCE
ncbi:MAG: hypothetical protein IT286_03150 [Proteobacteria bacterium]|nr:hypothetical protein [Pseudomonadota bacterium]